jgi:hypothetical protein
MADKDAEEFMHDWYAILGCDHTTTEEGISTAARKLAKKYHPDKTTDPEAPEKFLLVQKAKEILLDPTKRKVIDEKREIAAKRQAYEAQRNLSMDARRKRLREEFNDRLNTVNSAVRVPSEAEIFQAELKKRSKIIDDLRKKNSHLMEQSLESAMHKETQQAKDLLNHRKAAVEFSVGGCVQLKVKWKRNAALHTTDMLMNLFQPFGSVEDVSLIGSKGTSALVTFTSPADANKAVEHFRFSDDYRVSFFSSADGGGDGDELGAAGASSSSGSGSDLAGDIRRALEKKNLMNIINMHKQRTNGDSLAGNSVNDASVVGQSGYQLPGAAEKPVAPVPVAASAPIMVPLTQAVFAAKESDVLAKMMEAAAARKRKLSAAQTAVPVAP